MTTECDPDWLLHIAKARARHIQHLVEQYQGGELGEDGTLSAIIAAAQAILDDEAPG